MNTIKTVCDILYVDIHTKLTAYFSREQQCIHEDFFKIKDEFGDTVHVVIKHMRDFFKRIYNSNVSKNIAYFISNFIFYSAMVTAYESLNNKKNLFEYLCSVEYTPKDNYEYYERYYQFVNRYNGFIWSLKEKDKNVDFMNTYGVYEAGYFIDVTTKYLDHLINTLDDTIMTFRTCEKSETKKLINDISTRINMCYKLGDPVKFLEKYHEILQHRLFNKTYYDRDVKIEKKIVQLFINSIFSTDKDINKKIKGCIKLINTVIYDKLSRTKVNTLYRKIPLKFDTKNREIIEKFDRQKVVHTVLDRDSWKSVYPNVADVHNNNTKYHAIIDKHINVFNAFYESHFQELYGLDKHKKLDIDERNSMVSVNININGKDIKVVGTLIQINILYTVIHNREITVQDLLYRMNIKSAKWISDELNAIVLSDLLEVVKNENALNSVIKMKYDIDKQIGYINLVKYIDILKNGIDEVESDDEEEYESDDEEVDVESDKEDESDDNNEELVVDTNADTNSTESTSSTYIFE
jgi:hypothetical protein